MSSDHDQVREAGENSEGWSVLIPVGPSSLEVERVADTLDSLHAYEPGVGRVVLIDDEPDAHRDLVAAAGALADRTDVVANPRSRELEGWSDGLVVAVAAGLDLLRGDPRIAWTLKMDTDALVIGPFAASISERFARDPAVGMVGVHTHQPDGTPRDTSRATHHVEKLDRTVALWRRPAGPIRTTLIGRGRRRHQLLTSARRHGYAYGEHCQGGAYAVSMAAARAIDARGWSDPELWMRTRTAEDVVLAAEVRACGFTLAGMAAPGEPFAVSHIGLPGDPEALQRAGYGLLHSIKTHGDWTEDDLRALFRQHRPEHRPEG